MRTSLMVILIFALSLTGCVWNKRPSKKAMPLPRAGATAAARSGSSTNQALIAMPENALAGKVALVNSVARFVVLNFPLGKMATVEQHLNLYRRGLKVGEVKVTGPARDENIVADLVAGEAEVGDEARSQ